MGAESSQEFGEELRRDRELREVSREQLAGVTKVSMRHIAALESGRFEQLPAPVFSRGFVRSIAHHIGLDPDRSVAAFSHVYAAWEEKERSRETASAVTSGTHPMLRVPVRRNRATRTTIALAGTISVLLFGTLAASLLKSRPVPANSARTPSDRPESGAASLALPPAIAAAAVQLPPERSPFGAPAAPGADVREAPRAPQVVPAAAALSRTEGATAATGSRLTLRFRDDSWAEVSVDGKVVAAEFFRKGVTREFGAGRRFVLTLGNAGGVDVAVDGRSLRALGQPGEAVRDVSIEPRRS